VDKLRVFYNHPGFIDATAERVRTALEGLPEIARHSSIVIYTAHSIPMSMAESSKYVQQLEESCRLVSSAVGLKGHRLVYQSRSGPPAQPWLEPDILDVLREIKQDNSASGIVIAPVGFVSDHMEVLYDLDTKRRISVRSSNFHGSRWNRGNSSEIREHDSRFDC